MFQKLSPRTNCVQLNLNCSVSWATSSGQDEQLTLNKLCDRMQKACKWRGDAATEDAMYVTWSLSRCSGWSRATGGDGEKTHLLKDGGFVRGKSWSKWHDMPGILEVGEQIHSGFGESRALTLSIWPGICIVILCIWSWYMCYVCFTRLIGSTTVDVRNPAPVETENNYTMYKFCYFLGFHR